MASDATARAAEALLAYRRGGGPADPRARDLCRRLADAMRTNGTVGPHTTNSPAFLTLGLELVANRDPEVRALVDALAGAVAAPTHATPEIIAELYAQQGFHDRAAEVYREPIARDAGNTQTVNVSGNGNTVHVAGRDLYTDLRQASGGPMPQEPAASPFAVLFVAASPDHQAWLRVDREARAVRNALERSGLKRVIDLQVRMAVRPDDFLQALLSLRPRVVHFAGHGDAETGELLFEDDDGRALPAAAEGLRVIFSQLRGTVECVILNACHSRENAEAILASVPYVITTDGPLEDEAAITFSTGFYQALGEGRSVSEASEWGRGLLLLTRRGDGLPELMTRSE